MQQNTSTPNQFVIDLLTTLRKERFSITGWWRFFRRSWEMSCATANTNPALKRSWLSMTLLITTLAVLMLAATAVFEGAVAALRLLPGFAFCVAWQQSDFFWHLGLNRRVQTGELAQRIGTANTLTGLRGLGTAFLMGRLISGLFTPPWLVLGMYLVGITSDILDGLVARLTGTQSRLGQIMDAETDVCLYLAIMLTLIQDSLLPLWLAIVVLLRFCVPLLAALGSYFLFAQPVRFGSTLWGKLAGIAQCLYFLLLLAPPPLVPITRIANLPLLVVMLALLIIAPAAQIRLNALPARPQQ